MSKLFRRATVAVVISALCIGVAAPAFAHVERTVGKLKFTAEVQFPAKDPSNGDLAARIVGDEARTAAIKSTANSGKNTASIALILSIVGLALGAIGLGAAVLKRRPAKQA